MMVAELLPTIHATTCTGCGRCVSICPTECLEAINGLPWLPRPRDCVSCGVCQFICPVHAIEMASEAERQS